MNKISVDRTAKGTHELIGPPSANISLRDFLQEARSTIPFWRETDISKDITEVPFADLTPTAKAQLEARCSCESIRSDTQSWFDNDGLLADLKLWQWARLYCGSDDGELLNKAVLENASSATRNKAAALFLSQGKESKRAKKAAAAAAAAEEEAEQAVDILIDPSLQPSPAPPSPAPDTPQTDSATTSNKAPEPEFNPVTGKRKRAPPLQIVDPAILDTIDPLRTKIENAGLRSFGTFYEASAYMRKIRQSDYQSLSHLRVSTAPEQFMFRPDAPMPNAVGHEPEVVITVAFQPIPQRFLHDKDHAPVVPRLQKSCFLGSQTLGALRDALVCASTAVPTERDSMHEVDLLLAGTRPVLMDDDPNSVKWRYVNDKWKAGAVIMLDGKLYGDTRLGMRDYAADMATVVSDLNWDTDTNTLDPALDPALQTQPEPSTTYDPQYEYNPTTQPPPHRDENDSDPSRPSKRPKLTPSSYDITGKALHETTFYDILDGVRLGEPYWLMHHGNCEHVFVFEEIRLLHTSDPPPVMPLGPDQQAVSPYPVTTYLSRLNVNKCNICERDPATCVTVNDELAGMSPCPVCKECFRLLHGDLEGAKAKGIEVIGILEELETNK